MIDNLKRMAFLTAKSSLIKFRQKPTQKKTCLVAGAQRSGTNLVMDILETAWETDVYHERDPRAFNNYVMRPINEIQDLKSKSLFPTFVIKALCESQDLENIMNSLTPAKAVWVVRHYDDVAKSMQISFPRVLQNLKYMANRKSDGQWLSEGMSDQTYQLLQNLITELDLASACAFQWYFRNILYFENKFNLNPNIKVLFYQDLLSKPDTITQNLFNFFNLKHHPRSHKMIQSKVAYKNESLKLHPEVLKICEELWSRLLSIDSKIIIGQ